MKKETKKLSEKECIGYGGHCWNYELSKNLTREDETLSSFDEMEICHRVCKHCGKRQLEVPHNWIDVVIDG